MTSAKSPFAMGGGFCEAAAIRWITKRRPIGLIARLGDQLGRYRVRCRFRPLLFRVFELLRDLPELLRAGPQRRRPEPLDTADTAPIRRRTVAVSGPAGNRVFRL